MEVDLGEKHDDFKRMYMVGFRIMRGWFWTKVGMDLAKLLDVAKGGLIICFFSFYY